MKLTRRQEEFIVNLIDLNQELDGPIHYSLLAERLGVSPFTAYDMLRVLEKKGMVRSEYQLAEGKSGPGRAERLFCPVKPAKSQYPLPNQLQALTTLEEKEVRVFVEDKLRRDALPNQDLALELLDIIPQHVQDLIRNMSDFEVSQLRNALATVFDLLTVKRDKNHE